MLGRTVGHYRITDRLGGGGMGVVYRAEDVKLGRTVALKLLPPELTRDADAKRRFEREAKAASQLDHPNICTVYDFGEADGDGQMYMAMACYDGESLADTIERGPVPLDDAIPIVEQIARGLGKAHASGIVHRDIKPENVMITNDGVVKILDFGLAKLMLASKITRSSMTVGTPAYMAPEQLRGEEVGPQADIWALGVVLFELLTGGKHPFRGEYAEALAYSILNEQPAALPDQPEVDRIVKRMLRKDPLQRYQSIDDVLADLLAKRAPVEEHRLRNGAKLGTYEIVKPIAGDVYLATDKRLGRSAAIKIVPPGLGKSQLPAHPNIAALYEAGEQEGVSYVATELLDGETLAEKKTPLPLAQVLKLGAQIADGLAAAHSAGVVHKNLKPANVMIAASGAVKLVDFGVAREPLSPEQVEGRDADARSDIFALGAILYELISGKRAFDGETKASVSAAILEREPPPLATLPALEHVIRKCLAKDPHERWQSAADVASELEWIAAAPSTAAAAPRRAAVPWIVAAILGAVAVVAIVLALRAPSAASDALYHRYEIPSTAKHYSGVMFQVVSPDGRHFVCDATGDDGVSRLYMRNPGELEPKPIAGTEGADSRPQFSPDGQTMYFVARGNLKALRLSGGVPVDLGKVAFQNNTAGSFSVNADGVFLYSDGQRILSARFPGETPVAVTKLDAASGEVRHRWPSFLPDGKRFLFLAQARAKSGEETNTIYVASLGSERRKALVQATSRASYVPPGYLLFARNHTLFAVPFDLRREAVTGAEVPLVDDVNFLPQYKFAAFSASDDGVLTYRQRADRTRMGWLDAAGKELPGRTLAGAVNFFSVSPDGKRLAITIYDDTSGKADVWIYGLDRETSSRVTFEPLNADVPIWIDDHRIAYSSGEFGREEIRATSVDDPGQPVTLVPAGEWKWPTCVSPSDGTLIYTVAPDRRSTALLSVGGARREMWQIPLNGSAKPEPLLRGPLNFRSGLLSPNGRWLMYASDESGQWETYVRPYRRSGARVQVSTNGNTLHRWSRDGTKIFLFHQGQLSTVFVADKGDHLQLSEPQPLFTNADLIDFAEVPGGRFLVNLPLDKTNPPNIVITNWLALMHERMGK